MSEVKNLQNKAQEHKEIWCKNNSASWDQVRAATSGCELTSARPRCCSEFIHVLQMHCRSRQQAFCNWPTRLKASLGIS